MATWEISASITWEQYKEWIEQGDRGGYRRIGVSDRSLSFSRLERGDQFLVDVVAIAPAAPVRLRVTFTGRPD